MTIFHIPALNEFDIEEDNLFVLTRIEKLMAFVISAICNTIAGAALCFSFLDNSFCK